MGKHTVIDPENWDRRDHYYHFSNIYRPALSNMTVEMDVTRAYSQAKEQGIPFFAYYLYLSLCTVNSIKNLRYRQEEDKVVLYEELGAAFTVLRDDNSFGFARADASESLRTFVHHVKNAIDTCKREKGLPRGIAPSDVIHYTVLKDLHFSALSFSASPQEDVPKMAFGKALMKNGILVMPHAIQTPHMFVDGYHCSLYFNRFQELLHADIPLS